MQINSSANSLVWQRLEDKNNFRSKNDNNMIDNFVNRKVGEWPSRKLCIYQWNSRHPESLQSLKHYEIAQTETLLRGWAEIIVFTQGKGSKKAVHGCSDRFKRDFLWNLPSCFWQTSQVVRIQFFSCQIFNVCFKIFSRWNYKSHLTGSVEH